MLPLGPAVVVDGERGEAEFVERDGDVQNFGRLSESTTIVE